MRRFLIALIVCLAFCTASLAQQSADDTPATKEDIQRYLDAMHSHDMMRQVAEAMSKPMHQMVHEQFLKDKDKLPADFEARMNKMMDDMFRDMPWDDMLQAMAPVAVQTVPTALYNFATFDKQTTEGGATILIDVGAQNTDLIIVEPNSCWTRNIPLGGNAFTETLVRSFKPLLKPS